MAHSYCSSWEESRDLVQEVAMKTYSSASSYSPLGSFSAWLRKLVRNAAVDHVRRRRRDKLRVTGVDAEVIVDRRFTPERLHASKALREELRNALDALSDEQRTTVIMRYFGGMSLADIAWATRVPTGTVKSRLFNAMSKIRLHLGYSEQPTQGVHDD